MENVNTVESMLTQAQDDAAMGNQTPGTLAEVLGADDSSAAGPQQSSQPSAEQTTQEEPGWFKRRMEQHDKKLNEDFQRQLQAVRDDYEARLTPLREASYRREAEQLVADGEFKSIDRALEYVRLKDGAPVQQSTAPRNADRTEPGCAGPVCKESRRRCGAVRPAPCRSGRCYS